jgi:hypothetical protein
MISINWRKIVAKIKDTPTLAVTNPILLWLFAHGWEEPVGPEGQIAVGLAIRELAKQVEDREMAVKHVANYAGKLGSK